MDINNLCAYSASLWGTICDWCIFLATSVTGVAIWRSFNSQKQIQKMQQELIRIEQANFRQKFLPKLTIRGYQPLPSIPNDFSFIVRIEENPMTSLNISFEKSKYFTGLNSDVNRLRGNQINPGYDIHFGLTRLTGQQPGENKNYHFKINFTFTDSINNKYTQDVLLVFGVLEIQMPRYINNVEPERN